MHTSIRACLLYFFYNPYKIMSLFNSKNFFIYLSPLFFYLRPANFMLIISYMYIHDSLQTIAALYSFTYKCTCSKYTSKGLELFGLLTMELCFIKNVLQNLGVPCATCMTYITLQEALYVVTLMWDYSLMYGWP